MQLKQTPADTLMLSSCLQPLFKLQSVLSAERAPGHYKKLDEVLVTLRELWKLLHFCPA